MATVNVHGIFILLVATCIANSLHTNDCPPEEDIYPCICMTTTIGGLYIECGGLSDVEQLKEPFDSLRGKNVFGVGIVNSNLPYFPNGFLQETNTRGLYVRNSRVKTIADPSGGSPFEGVEDTLTHIEIEASGSLNTWNWADFNILNQISNFLVKNSEIIHFSNDIGKMLNVNNLAVTAGNISSLGKTVFSEMNELESLDLRNNFLSDLENSMLPSSPRCVLHSINLSYNRFKELRGDVFNHITSLMVVDLSFNLIQSLSPFHYKSVFNKVRTLHLQGNPLVCDCRIIWVLNYPTPHLEGDICGWPPQLSGRKLTTLTEEDVWCFKNMYM